MILSGVFALALVVLMTSVRADGFPQTAAPGNIPPRVYMIWSSYDICKRAQYDGSRPDGMDLQTAGCLSLPDSIRFEQYAFTGETLEYGVVVRDLNGAQDISYAKMTVAGLTESLCVEDSAKQADFVSQVPAWETAPAGFNVLTDKYFICHLTVEPQWHGQSYVNIDAYDQVKAVSTMSIAQSWFFNPAIMLTLATNDGSPAISYESGVPGQTVMSTNKLVVTNLAEGGVDLWTFIAATDLTDPSHSGALCPESNVLNVDHECAAFQACEKAHPNDISGCADSLGENAAQCIHNMDFRCKIGTQENDQWTGITNKNNVAGCNWDSCYDAKPLLPDFVDPLSIIKNQGTAECQFRLTYPVPCIGNFSDGMIQIIVKSV
jgi:hypothetical protein